jgi:hypothetical protein
MPVSISGDGAITGLELEAFEDVDVGSGASDGDVLTYDASGDLWIPQGIVPIAGIGLNVVNVIKTDVFSTTSATFVEVTGLAATITPTTDSSKILALVTVTGSGATSGGFSDQVVFRLVRTSTPIGIGTDGTTYNVTGTLSIRDANAENLVSASAAVLDSPATAAAVTYKVEVAIAAGFTLRINRSAGELVAAVSTITLIEVAA